MLPMTSTFCGVAAVGGGTVRCGCQQALGRTAAEPCRRSGTFAPDAARQGSARRSAAGTVSLQVIVVFASISSGTCRRRCAGCTRRPAAAGPSRRRARDEQGVAQLGPVGLRYSASSTRCGERRREPRFVPVGRDGARAREHVARRPAWGSQSAHTARSRQHSANWPKAFSKPASWPRSLVPSDGSTAPSSTNGARVREQVRVHRPELGAVGEAEVVRLVLADRGAAGPCRARC